MNLLSIPKSRPVFSAFEYRVRNREAPPTSDPGTDVEAVTDTTPGWLSRSWIKAAITRVLLLSWLATVWWSREGLPHGETKIGRCLAHILHLPVRPSPSAPEIRTMAAKNWSTTSDRRKSALLFRSTASAVAEFEGLQRGGCEETGQKKDRRRRGRNRRGRCRPPARPELHSGQGQLCG